MWLMEYDAFKRSRKELATNFLITIVFRNDSVQNTNSFLIEYDDRKPNFLSLIA